LYMKLGASGITWVLARIPNEKSFSLRRLGEQ
jgi:hypothetical protein